jgi:hypothetical protein
LPETYSSVGIVYTAVRIPTYQWCSVFSLKVERQIAASPSAERGSLIRTVICKSSASHFGHKRVNMKAEILDGALPCRTAGCIQAESFLTVVPCKV